MAFFGLTSQGPQNPFRAATEAVLGLSLFSEQDLRYAFEAASREGTVGPEDADDLLEQLYRGPPPKSHEARLKSAILDGVGGDPAGRMGYEALSVVVARLKAEEDAEAAENESRATTGEFSAKELLDKRAHHVRVFDGPRETLTAPLTTGQAAGWAIEREDTVEAAKAVQPKTKCAETRFAERLLKAGELL